MIRGGKLCFLAGVCVYFASPIVCAQTVNTVPPLLPANSETTTNNGDNKDEHWVSNAYGDWLLRCKVLTQAGDKKTCEVVQQLQSNNVVIAQIAFGSVAAQAKAPAEMNMVVVLPNNVLVTAPVQASFDENDKTPLKLSFKRCLPTGCFASSLLPSETLKRWKQGDHRGRLAFTNGVNQEVALPFSFRGLGDALEAMTKS